MLFLTSFYFSQRKTKFFLQLNEIKVEFKDKWFLWPMCKLKVVLQNCKCVLYIIYMLYIIYIYKWCNNEIEKGYNFKICNFYWYITNSITVSEKKIRACREIRVLNILSIMIKWILIILNDFKIYQRTAKGSQYLTLTEN